MHRKLVKVYFDLYQLIQMVTQDKTVNMTVIQGLPPDAQMVSLNYDHERLQSYCIFMHDSFPIVPHGSAIPILEVKVRNNA